MADKNTESFDLTAPTGTKVTVEGKGRRDALLARGYTEGHGAPKKATPPKTEKAQKPTPSPAPKTTPAKPADAE